MDGFRWGTPWDGCGPAITAKYRMYLSGGVYCEAQHFNQTYYEALKIWQVLSETRIKYNHHIWLILYFVTKNQTETENDEPSSCSLSTRISCHTSHASW
jgi:hypothetical protein